MKTLRTIGTVAVTGAVLALVPMGSAMADESEGTVTTFTLEGGAVTLDTADTAPWGTGTSTYKTGAASITGSLGEVVVTDARGGTVAWGMTAISSTFVDGAGSISTGVSYNSGTFTAKTGTVTPTSTGATNIAGVAPVAAGTAVSGNNTATYIPALTVALPASALVGVYTGTVTTSVA